jgi:hypothetical protein
VGNAGAGMSEPVSVLIPCFNAERCLAAGTREQLPHSYPGTVPQTLAKKSAVLEAQRWLRCGCHLPANYTTRSPCRGPIFPDCTFRKYKATSFMNLLKRWGAAFWLP